MQVFVSTMSNVSRMTSKHDITHVLSLIEPGKKPFLHPQRKVVWQVINFSDDWDPNVSSAPKREDVKEIIKFGRELEEDARVLVHCYAGISRSTAGALIMLHLNDPELAVDELVDRIIKIRDVAYPNELICRYADEILGIDKLHKAAKTTQKISDEKYGSFTV